MFLTCDEMFIACHVTPLALAINNGIEDAIQAWFICWRVATESVQSSTQVALLIKVGKLLLSTNKLL